MKLRVLSRARETIYEGEEKVNRDVDTSLGAETRKNNGMT